MPIILALMLITGMFIGSKLSVINNESRFFIYPQINKITSIINYIDEEYVDSIVPEELIEDAVPILLNNLDPHSVYIPAKDLIRTNEPLEGNFDGIGVEFNIQKDTIVIVNIISGGPSEKIGILPGDRIVMVDDSLIAGIGLTNGGVVSLLKGERGTTVKVGVKRNRKNELLDFEIIRDKIPLYSIDASFLIDNETGYIKISRFSKTTYDEFISSIEKLQLEGIKNIIIDLRGNGGGYLEIATSLIDEFLEKDKLIVYTEGRSRPKQSFYSTTEGKCKSYKLVVLIDELSASASEIFAGAIQDNDRGTIMGRRSFGKGLVQEQTRFHDGSALRLTVARYYTPTGRSIQKPYGKKHDDYYHELNNRYLHGEFSEIDSISFADSLRFVTPKGKIVYGGGGIMPDIFVPVDTVGISNYYIKVRDKGLIYKFAFDYADKNREKLNDFKDFIALVNYLKKSKLLDEFVGYAKKEGVTPNWKDINYSAEVLNTMLHAQITRNIFDDDGFFPVISTIDNTLQKAVKLFHEK